LDIASGGRRRCLRVGLAEGREVGGDAVRSEEGGAVEARARQAALSRRTGLDRSDMVAALAALEGDGLVRRETDAGDRRRNVVTLTGAGRARLAALDARIAELQEAVLAPLDPGERAELVRLLQALVRHHGGALAVGKCYGRRVLQSCNREAASYIWAAWSSAIAPHGRASGGGCRRGRTR
jgi:DNA-binding MarR family transcriptional regulator